jgi:hypothetical protein
MTGYPPVGEFHLFSVIFREMKRFSYGEQKTKMRKYKRKKKGEL